jgi:plasmid stabilization system protein ParE
MRDLDGIWEWNAERDGAEHAEAYVSFLRSEAYKLDRNYPHGKPVYTAPEFLYVHLPKSHRKQSHHHLAVFQIVNETVEVLRFYHSRQDWENRFIEGR